MVVLSLVAGRIAGSRPGGILGCRSPLSTQQAFGYPSIRARSSLGAGESKVIAQVDLSGARPDQVDLVVDAVSVLESARRQPEACLAQFFTAETPLQDTKILSSLFRFDHIGLLLGCSPVSKASLVQDLQQHGLSVSQRFPSQVLAAILKPAYQRSNIDIEVVKLKKGTAMVELFVTSGLTNHELENEGHTRNHLAMTPKTTNPQDAYIFADIMGRNGAVPAGSGMNSSEKSKTADGQNTTGVTVLYFASCTSSAAPIRKIELCVPGLHPELLQLSA